ncbi:TPA: DUF5085 family protein [Staphylococcus aureus]|nr:DUF5085 family protein [Staphylococcus aureus]
MELDALVMPNLAKMEFSINPEYWKDEMSRIKSFFIDKRIYTVGPIVFTREVVGLDEMKFVTYISLNSEIDDIPSIALLPTISHKCFDEDEFENVYMRIKEFAVENNITLSNSPFYHVMVDYFGGQVYEIHAEINLDEDELE